MTSGLQTVWRVQACIPGSYHDTWLENLEISMIPYGMARTVGTGDTAVTTRLRARWVGFLFSPTPPPDRQLSRSSGSSTPLGDFLHVREVTPLVECHGPVRLYIAKISTLPCP